MKMKRKKMTYAKQFLIVLIAVVLVVILSFIINQFALKMPSLENIDVSIIIKAVIRFIIDLIKDNLDKIL
jgi:hypothetical protein